MITGGRGGTGLFGGASGSDSVVAQLARGRRDASIKAVVVRINSPGGSAAASQEIYAELMKIRKAGKPVVASMGDVAASGGYYVAAAADRIVANGSTLTGSIGVVMEMQNLQGLFQKIGVRSNTIKSGKFKDIGSSTRPMTPEERELLQGLVNDVYEQFVGAIIAGRKQVDPARLRQLADGRIFTGRQAHALKLVDELGNLQDAVATAARLAGIRGRPTVVELRRTSLLDTLTGGEPGVGSDLRLPVGAAEEERLVRALRRLMYEQAVPR
ncbi:MAG: signal peptide peptidase SppA [Armatimonadetes bacterium]|nr:signal peptide peptidase SppA [Armatimonadota bacterium]